MNNLSYGHLSIAPLLNSLGLANRLNNISSGKGYTFQDIVDVTKKAFPQTQIGVTEVSKFGLRKEPVNLFPYDISVARNEFGYDPDFDLESAFRDYGHWLMQTRSGTR